MTRKEIIDKLESVERLVSPNNTPIMGGIKKRIPILASQFKCQKPLAKLTNQFFMRTKILSFACLLFIIWASN